MSYLYQARPIKKYERRVWSQGKVALRRAFTPCGCVFKEITLVSSNQGNYFEYATACSKRTLKTTVATQLKVLLKLSKCISGHLGILVDLKTVKYMFIMKFNFYENFLT